MGYDSDGIVESTPNESDGLLQAIRILLPPTGIDSISWQAIGQSNNLTMKKAYYNYHFIKNDSSKGMHNSKFSIDVLLKTRAAFGSVIPVELTSFNSELKGSKVVLNLETASETNNSGFEIERKSGSTWTNFGFVKEIGTTTEISIYSFTDNPKAQGLNGTVS